MSGYGPLAKEVYVAKGKLPPALAKYVAAHGGFGSLARARRHQRANLGANLASMRQKGGATPAERAVESNDTQAGRGQLIPTPQKSAVSQRRSK